MTPFRFFSSLTLLLLGLAILAVPFSNSIGRRHPDPDVVESYGMLIAIISFLLLIPFTFITGYIWVNPRAKVEDLDS